MRQIVRQGGRQTSAKITSRGTSISMTQLGAKIHNSLIGCMQRLATDGNRDRGRVRGDSSDGSSRYRDSGLRTEEAIKIFGYQIHPGRGGFRVKIEEREKEEMKLSFRH